MNGVTYSHLCAFFSSAVTASAVAFNLPAVNDGILTQNNAQFNLPQDADLIGVYGQGANMTTVVVNTPNLRYVGLPNFPFLNTQANVTSPQKMNWNIDMPPRIPKVDFFAVQVNNSDSGAPHPMSVLTMLRFQKAVVTPAPAYVLHGTAAITNVSGSWANGSITMDTTLPAGRYQVTGMDVVGANVLGARLIFPGASFRPGVIARSSTNDLPIANFMNDVLGPLGEFDSINLPNLEIFCNGSGSAQDVWLKLIKIS